MAQFCKVTHRLGVYVEDSPLDGDREPDYAPISGRVTFRPRLREGESFKVRDEHGYRTVPVVPIEATIQDGEIVHEGEPGVLLFAGGPNSNPGVVRYEAIYSNLFAGGKTISLSPIEFDAVPGGEVDLADHQPVGNAPTPGVVQGPAGPSPTIGENGNWWIGDEDTGVPAAGGGGGTGLPQVETFPLDLDTYSISLEEMGADDWPWELTNDGYKFDVTPQAQGGFAGFAMEIPRSEIAHLATEDEYVDFEIVFKGDEQLLGESVTILIQGLDAESGAPTYGYGKMSQEHSTPTFTDCSWTREHISLWVPDGVGPVRVIVYAIYQDDKPAWLEVAEMAFRPGKNRTQYPPQHHKHSMDEAGLSILRGSSGITAEYRDEYNDRIILFGDTGQRRLDVEQGWESENGLIIRRINFTVSLHGEVTCRDGSKTVAAEYPQRSLSLGRELRGVAYGKDDPSHIRHFTFYEDYRGHVRIDNPEPDVTYVIDKTWQVNPVTGAGNGPWGMTLPGTPVGNSYWVLEAGD